MFLLLHESEANTNGLFPTSGFNKAEQSFELNVSNK